MNCAVSKLFGCQNLHIGVHLKDKMLEDLWKYLKYLDMKVYLVIYHDLMCQRLLTTNILQQGPSLRASKL